MLAAKRLPVGGAGALVRLHAMCPTNGGLSHLPTLPIDLGLFVRTIRRGEIASSRVSSSDGLDHHWQSAATSGSGCKCLGRMLVKV